MEKHLHTSRIDDEEFLISRLAILLYIETLFIWKKKKIIIYLIIAKQYHIQKLKLEKLMFLDTERNITRLQFY